MLRRTLSAALLTAFLPSGAFAADHIDSPTSVADPAADINDVYAWTTSDATRVNLVMSVSPFAAAGTAFSDAVIYTFHVNSSSAYGAAQTETLVTCQFYDVDAIECWVGDAYVTGDPSVEGGVANDDDTIRVFAGLRDDAFFFELTGFRNAVATVKAAAGALTFDAQGCPSVDAATSGVLVGLLQSGADGADASDTFAGANTLALVVQVDKSLLTAGGPILGVWASTHRAE